MANSTSFSPRRWTASTATRPTSPPPYKHLKFAGAPIVTLAEGEISECHVGLKGTMNALFLKDLAAKTHRGIRGRVEEGKNGGGLCYGYKVVKQLDERSEPGSGRVVFLVNGLNPKNSRWRACCRTYWPPSLQPDHSSFNSARIERRWSASANWPISAAMKNSGVASAMLTAGDASGS